MKISVERYEGNDEKSGYFSQGPGSTYRFAADADEFRFNVEDSAPERAVSLRSLVGGREVMIQTRAPWASGSPAIGIPSHNPLFDSALREMMRNGVQFVSFLDTSNGGFRQFDAADLLHPLHGAPAPTMPSGCGALNPAFDAARKQTTDALLRAVQGASPVVCGPLNDFGFFGWQMEAGHSGYPDQMQGDVDYGVAFLTHMIGQGFEVAFAVTLREGSAHVCLKAWEPGEEEPIWPTGPTWVTTFRHSRKRNSLTATATAGH